MNIPEGYKQTEVGVIPDDWEVKKLSEIVEDKRPISYGIVQTGKNIENGVRCIRVIDIVNGKVDQENLIHTSEAISDSYRRTILKNGDLIIALRGKIGELAVIDDDLVGANLTRGVALIAPKINNYNYFLYHYLSSPTSKSILEKNLNGSALQEISIGVLRKIPTLLPHTIEEQKTIALSLSDTDALITECDRLITKKRHIKQGTMQQLLTGKKRLPGFSGEWEVKKLGEIFEFKNGLNKEKKYFGVGTPIVNYMDVYKNRGLTARDLKGKVTVTEKELKAYQVHKDDVFFSRTSETVDEIGISSVILENLENTVFSGFVLRARPKNNCMNTFYKKYCFSSQSVRSEITSKSSYTTRALTNGKLLSQVQIPLPPTQEEQKAIAQILSDMDAEIAALEQKRDKYKALKQGMMQELLTGKTRLKNNSAD